MRAALPLVAVLLCVALAAPAGADPRRPLRLDHLSEDDLDRVARGDLRRLKSYTLGVSRLRRELREQRALFDKPKDVPLSPDERRAVLGLFEQVLDYTVALDSLSRFHGDFWRIRLAEDPLRHARHFLLGFASRCLRMSLGFSFIDRTLGKPQFEKLLDEGAPELGVPAGAYARLKWNVVHVKDVGEMVASHQYHRVLAQTAYESLSADDLVSYAMTAVDVTYPELRRTLRRRGVRLFGGNGVDILKDRGHEAWLPMQTGVAELMGDTRVHREERMLVSEEQIREAVRRSQPGDVLVERRNWYLSNVGLPGFWPHAALYVGTREELATFLDEDPEVQRHYGGPFTAALKRRHPKAWAAWTSTDEERHPYRVLEAVSEGVLFTTAEHSLHADYVAALRPRLSKLEVARAIERAFGYVWRPYDFDFDFYTDTSLVCSELVYKAYEPCDDAKGLALPLEQLVGRMTLSPNTLVRLFDEQYDTERRQLDFAWFLDGRESEGKAIWSDVGALRASHRRPKWDFVQK